VELENVGGGQRSEGRPVDETQAAPAGSRVEMGTVLVIVVLPSWAMALYVESKARIVVGVNDDYDHQRTTRNRRTDDENMGIAKVWQETRRFDRKKNPKVMSCYVLMLKQWLC
jgi:hypothetical protein